MFIDPILFECFMAKSDAFYIRAQVTGNATYAQQEIDLGSFVNLGVKSSTLLRIHSVQVAITDANNAETPPAHTSGFGIGWQLTTESQPRSGLDERQVGCRIRIERRLQRGDSERDFRDWFR